MGRPRKAGVIREPNGRASRSDRVLHIQRKLDAIRKLAMSAEMGTPLGVLLTWEKITKAQYEAGEWFADARKAADGALSLPPRNPTAQDMNALHGSSNAQETPEQEKAKRKAVETYDRAEAFVGLGSKRFAALQSVVVYERRPDTHEQFLHLVEALDLLVKFRTIRRAA